MGTGVRSFQIQILMCLFLLSPSFLEHNLLDLIHCVLRLVTAKLRVSFILSLGNIPDDATIDKHSRTSRLDNYTGYSLNLIGNFGVKTRKKVWMR